MKKKQTGHLRNLHLRVQEKDYEKVQAICKTMDITMAEYYNSLLHSDGYDEMIRYAKILMQDNRLVEISFADEDTKKRVDELVTALNAATDQTRRIGTNLSALIRDIRLGNVNAQQAIPHLEQLRAVSEKQRDAYQQSGGELAKLLFSDDGIQKKEIRIRHRDFEE